MSEKKKWVVKIEKGNTYIVEADKLIDDNEWFEFADDDGTKVARLFTDGAADYWLENRVTEIPKEPKK